jgi:hypothetical protein
MQRLEVNCAVRPIYGSLGAKGYYIYLLLTKQPYLIGTSEYRLYEEVGIGYG